MSTNNQQQPTPQWWNDRTILRYHLAQSNYVTASWNWFMMLAGKAAEPFLFASVLYSGYKLLPGVPQPSAGLDAFMFVAQQATLDIGGMGLMKLAQQAHQDKHSFAYRIGFILVGLMIANVVVASLERLIPLGGAVTVIEGVLLVARAIMAVLYGHAVHSLRGDVPEATGVVKTVDVHHRLDEVSHTLQHFQQAIELHFQQMEGRLERSVLERTQALTESMQAFTPLQIESLSTLHTESLALVESGFQEYLNERLLESLAPIVSTLQNHADTLAQIHALMPTLTEEVTRIVKVSLEQQTRVTRSAQGVPPAEPAAMKRLRPPQHVATPAPRPTLTEGEFDKKQFVYACLQEDSTMTIAAMQERAARFKQTISIGCVSGHRKTFFESLKATESTFISDIQTPLLKVVESLPAPESESPDKSFVESKATQVAKW